jgi:hypothetical protein
MLGGLQSRGTPLQPNKCIHALDGSQDARLCAFGDVPSQLSKVKQSRNVSQQNLTIGLDVGDRNSWYCVVDEGGRTQVSSESVRLRGVM